MLHGRDSRFPAPLASAAIYASGTHFELFHPQETTLEALADADIPRIWHDGWQALLRTIRR